MLLTKRLIVGSQYGILFAREGEEYGSSQCENYEQPDERKNVSYSLWNDSLLGECVKPGYRTDRPEQVNRLIEEFVADIL